MMHRAHARTHARVNLLLLLLLLLNYKLCIRFCYPNSERLKIKAAADTRQEKKTVAGITFFFAQQRPRGRAQTHARTLYNHQNRNRYTFLGCQGLGFKAFHAIKITIKAPGAIGNISDGGSAGGNNREGSSRT